MDPLEVLDTKLKTESGRKEILNDFATLQADVFFEKYGGGNYINDPQSIPYKNRNHLGRIHAYLDLLDLLKKHNPNRFYETHKGTPYCLLGWLLLDSEDYERGIFYMDAAISEDARTDPLGWQKRPASLFMFLETKEKYSPIGIRITDKIKKSITSELRKFNKHFDKKSRITIKSLKDKFVKPRIDETSHRTLICSIYVFILEAEERTKLLKRRSKDKGSVQPFLNHLHRGSLIFESLLKETYTSLNTLTLGSILTDPFVKKDLNVQPIDTGKVGSTLDDIVNHLIPNLRTNKQDPLQNQWFTHAYKLRNATSHSLLLPDIFNEKMYKILYRQILFSMFYLIQKKYVTKRIL